MASAREKIPQLGLWDDEVAKPTHDKMVLWAHANAEYLVRQYLREFPSLDYVSTLSPEWARNSITIRSNAKLEDLPCLPPKPSELVRQKELEKVIQQFPEHGRSMPRILGYADLVITWVSPEVEWIAEEKDWNVSNRPSSLLVEVKTVLPSLGELMRQINLYRLVYRHVIVVAPDDSFAEILKEQGVLFVQYGQDVSTN